MEPDGECIRMLFAHCRHVYAELLAKRKKIVASIRLHERIGSVVSKVEKQILFYARTGHRIKPLHLRFLSGNVIFSSVFAQLTTVNRLDA